MKCDVFNLKSGRVDQLTLDPSIFGQEERIDILSRVIEWQLSKRRSGNHKTKIVSEVQGSTRKIYKQKGTGGARHGSKRQVQFRGGGVVFGPLVRSHEHGLPKKIRKLGLKVAISCKFSSNNILVLDHLDFPTPKSKDFLGVISQFELNNALFVDHLVCNESNLVKAISNLKGFKFLPQIGLNVYDIIAKEKLVLTVQTIKMLEERLK